MSHVAHRPRRSPRLVALAAGAVLGVLIPLGAIQVMFSAQSTEAPASSAHSDTHSLAVPLHP